MSTRRYTSYYLSRSGQVYWSDTHQLSFHLENYHTNLDKRLNSKSPATEIITEIYVPRNRLVDSMEEAAIDLRRNGVIVVYGTAVSSNRIATASSPERRIAMPA